MASKVTVETAGKFIAECLSESGEMVSSNMVLRIIEYIEDMKEEERVDEENNIGG